MRKLINITLLPNGQVMINKTGKVLTPLPLDVQIERDKLKGKEWK